MITAMALVLLPAWHDARALEVSVLQSDSLPVYSQLAESIVSRLQKAEPRGAGKRLAPVSTSLYVLTRGETLPRDQLKQSDVLIAIGAPALEAARDFGPPVIHLLVPSPAELVGKRKHVTGIDMAFPPETWARVTAKALPGRKRVGLLYSTETASWAREAEAQCSAAGLELVSRRFETGHDFFATLQTLAGRVDQMWLIPDRSLIRPEMLELLLLFSLENRVPLVAFSERLLKAGAALALLPDLEGMADQTVRLILNHLPKLAGRPLSPRLETLPTLRWNEAVVGKLGLPGALAR